MNNAVNVKLDVDCSQYANSAINQACNLAGNSTDNFEKIQHLQLTINSLNWYEKLSLDPPRPSASHPINQVNAKKWVELQYNDLAKTAAEKLLKNTIHIQQSEFELELYKSVDKFNSWLNNQPSKDYVIVVTSEKAEKSNRWVAELALSHLKVLPKQVINISDNKNIEKGLSTKLLDYYKNHPDALFVFLDDAAYGCSQSKGLVCHLTNIDFWAKYGPQSCHPNDCLHKLESHKVKLLKLEKNHKVAAIIPFMTDSSCILPSSKVISDGCALGAHTESHIHVFNSRKIPTLDEFLTTEELAALQCKEHQVSLYFDHKLADGISTCPYAYRDGLISPVFVPGLPPNEGTPQHQFIDKFIPPYWKTRKA